MNEQAIWQAMEDRATAFERGEATEAGTRVGGVTIPFRLDSPVAWERAMARLDLRDWDYFLHRQSEDPPLPFRAFNGVWHALSRKGKDWVTPEDASRLRAGDLLAEEGFGRASLDKVKAWLASYGLTLGERA
jgi:hypothetical protein